MTKASEDFRSSLFHEAGLTLVGHYHVIIGAWVPSLPNLEGEDRQPFSFLGDHSLQVGVAQEYLHDALRYDHASLQAPSTRAQGKDQLPFDMSDMIRHIAHALLITKSGSLCGVKLSNSVSYLDADPFV